MDSIATTSIKYKKPIPKRMFDHFSVLFLHGLIEEGFTITHSELEYLEASGSSKMSYKLKYREQNYDLFMIYSRLLENVNIVISFSIVTDLLDGKLTHELDVEVCRILREIKLEEEG